MSAEQASLNRSFATLRRLAVKRAPAERCELCGLDLAPEHEHLLAPSTRQMSCACYACAMLFPNEAGGKYRRVSKRIRFLPGFELSDGLWDSLLIPINLAFFSTNSEHSTATALYPSPAGAVESQLPLTAWDEIVADNPVLETLETDVEALLVNRLARARGGEGEAEHYLVPIDQCFKLVGLIRTHWRGLSGGTEVWDEIDGFFRHLRQCAEPAKAALR